MNLIVDMVMDEPGDPFYRAIFTHEKKYLATKFDQKPTVEDVINFVNYCGRKLEEAPLYDPEKFFTLPVADRLGSYLQPLLSGDQPTGFRDEDGVYWVGVATEDGLKRQRLR